MKKFVTIPAFIFLFAGFAYAQETKVITGVITERIAENKWSGVIIKVGDRKYSIQTAVNVSSGDLRDGRKPWMLETTGNIVVGKTVRVYYTKIERSFDHSDVTVWLKATKIIEIRNSGSLRKK